MYVSQFSTIMYLIFFFFFFQAEDGIRDGHVTGVQPCALPIWTRGSLFLVLERRVRRGRSVARCCRQSGISTVQRSRPSLLLASDRRSRGYRRGLLSNRRESKGPILPRQSHMRLGGGRLTPSIASIESSLRVSI